MKVTRTELPDVLVLEYETIEEPRGKIYTNHSRRQLLEAGVTAEFVEEYLYCPSKRGTLYGIHFQLHPKAQTKLISCARGRGMDYAIDLRRGSATYKRWVRIELSEENRKMVLVPPGFGHAFVTLTDDTRIVYRIDTYSDPALKRAITYRDPDLNIDFGVENPILSEQDRNAPTLRECDCNY